MPELIGAPSGNMSRKAVTRITAAAAVLLLALASCTGSREATRVIPDMGEASPGEVLIMGTLLQVDTLRAERPTDPCSRNPCYATIRIDSVLEYGSGFPRPLSSGEELSARFAFTLSPTDDVLPELSEPFPGMSEGDAFQAKMRAAIVPVTSSDDPMFVIYEYYMR